MKKFIIEQKITAFANQYRVFATDDSGNKHELLAFAYQKRLAFKEKFEVFTDETKSSLAFSAEARQVFDFGARYEIRDTENAALGLIGKDFKKSLFRSTWLVFAPNTGDTQPVLISQERDPMIAALRRIWGFLPFVGDFPFPFRFHFDILDANTQAVKGHVTKTTRLRDHYELALEDELLEQFDYRVYIALGIMLDAMQSR